MRPDFTLKLLDWNQSHNNRPMPWKGETNPYRIWLSEVILQQTRVEQGWAYYIKFLEAFPDIEKLAVAPDQLVFKMWEGLGYYSRCRNLLATARLIVSDYKGVFPQTYQEILKLKGVGPYTAAAIASFAFNESRAVVDGNVQRVLSRYFGISTPIDSAEGKKLYAELAQALIDETKPGLYNQAIMDFGATICKPKNPLCESCIQRHECEAFKHGFVNSLPVKEKSLIKKTRYLNYFIIEAGDAVFIRKRGAKDIWQNLHEFILMEHDEPVHELPREFMSNLLGTKPFTLKHMSALYTQQLTHQKITGRFFIVTVAASTKLGGEYLRVKRADINAYAFPKFINKFLETTPLRP